MATASPLPSSSTHPAHLKALFSWQLHVLANLSTRLAVQENERDHGLAMREWRIVALLGAFAPLSLNALARELGLDKSQTSRAVTDLSERGYISRATDAHDARGLQLSLSRAGLALYRRAFPQAVARNEALLAALTREEREVMERALGKLARRARELLDAERERPAVRRAALVKRPDLKEKTR